MKSAKLRSLSLQLLLSALLLRAVVAQEAPSGAQPEQPASPLPERVESSEPRASHLIRLDLLRYERGFAKAGSDQQRVDSVLALCQLFVELGEHPDLATTPALQSLSVRLRTRLAGIEHRIAKELQRRKIPMPAALAELERQDRIRRARGQAPVTRLGDWSGGSAAGGDEGAANRSGLGSEHSSSGHAAPGPDYGWELVNLIRMTIQPDYWSTAGGPGKALYFGNARALVIHGSWRIQEDVADLLAALRGG